MIKDPLNGKKILLGVTGCIAAYKSCLIVRELVKRGAKVKVVMTPSAVEFITPLTLSTLSQSVELALSLIPQLLQYRVEVQGVYKERFQVQHLERIV